MYRAISWHLVTYDPATKLKPSISVSPGAPPVEYELSLLELSANLFGEGTGPSVQTPYRLNGLLLVSLNTSAFGTELLLAATQEATAFVAVRALSHVAAEISMTLTTDGWTRAPNDETHTVMIFSCETSPTVPVALDLSLASTVYIAILL